MSVQSRQALRAKVAEAARKILERNHWSHLQKRHGKQAGKQAEANQFHLPNLVPRQMMALSTENTHKNILAVLPEPSLLQRET